MGVLVGLFYRRGWISLVGIILFVVGGFVGHGAGVALLIFGGLLIVFGGAARIVAGFKRGRAERDGAAQ